MAGLALPVGEKCRSWTRLADEVWAAPVSACVLDVFEEAHGAGNLEEFDAVKGFLSWWLMSRDSGGSEGIEDML